MKRKALILTAAAAAIVLGAATFLPAYAHGPGTGGWGGGPGYGMGMGQGMGPGMMGQGHGPAMMGPGMGHGYGMGPGMMGPGQQAYGPGNCPFAAAQGGEITVDSVTKFLESRLAHWGAERLKVGKVEEADKTIVGKIVTKDGSLVHKFAFDKATGRPRPVN